MRKRKKELVIERVVEQMQAGKEKKAMDDGELRRKAYIDSLDPRERVNLKAESE